MSTKKIRRENVIALIDERYSGNKASFARAIDRPAPNIHRMLVQLSDDQKDKRGIGEDLARDIEKKLGLSAGWLDTPHYLTGSTDTSYVVNTETGPDIKGKVPLISWVQAGQFCASPDLYQPGDAEDWIPSFRDCGPHGYALRVVGDSMVSPFPGHISYLPGMIIVVNPEAQVEIGSPVVARIGDSEEATFKIYTEDGGEKFLKPLNPQYKTIPMDESIVICGVVVGAWLGS